jgi:hypothetical protein
MQFGQLTGYQWVQPFTPEFIEVARISLLPIAA